MPLTLNKCLRAGYGLNEDLHGDPNQHTNLKHVAEICDFVTSYTRDSKIFNCKKASTFMKGAATILNLEADLILKEMANLFNSDEENRSSISDEENRSSISDEENRSSISDEENRSSISDEENRSSISDEENRSSISDEENRSSISDEENRSSISDEENRSSISESLTSSS